MNPTTAQAEELRNEAIELENEVHTFLTLRSKAYIGVGGELAVERVWIYQKHLQKAFAAGRKDGIEEYKIRLIAQGFEPTAMETVAQATHRVSEGERGSE